MKWMGTIKHGGFTTASKDHFLRSSANFDLCSTEQMGMVDALGQVQDTFPVVIHVGEKVSLLLFSP